MRRINLDMDVLRTLVTAQELGGFNRAAAQLGRSQSAVSQQIDKLEERLGQALVQKQGRGWILTPAGETLLAYARRILELNDEAVTSLQGSALDGTVRFGVPADFAETWLTGALESFKSAYPAVHVVAVVDRNRVLLDRLDRGELDLVLSLGNGMRSDAEKLADVPLEWIGSANANSVWKVDEPIPLAVFEAPCFFRQRALDMLDKSGMPWRIAFTSPNLSGLWAAVAAGLGITVRTAVGLPAGVRVFEDARLPSLQNAVLDVCLHNAGRPSEPAVSRLRSIISEALLDGD